MEILFAPAQEATCRTMSTNEADPGVTQPGSQVGAFASEAGYTFFVPSKRRKFFGLRVQCALDNLNTVNPPPVFDEPQSAEADAAVDEVTSPQPNHHDVSPVVLAPVSVPSVPRELGPTLEYHHHVASRHAGGEAPPLESLRRLTDVEALAARARWHERNELGHLLVAAAETTTMTADEKQRQALVEKRLWVGLQCDRRDDTKGTGHRKAKWFEDKPVYSPAVLMLSQISSKAVASLQKKQNVKAGAHLLQLDPPLVEPYHPLPLVSRVYFDIPGFELSVVDVILSYEAICLMNPTLVTLFDAAERLADRRCMSNSIHALQSARASSPDSLRTGRCAVLSLGDVAVAYNVFPELPSFEFPRADAVLPIRPHHGPYKRCRVNTWVDQWDYYLRLEEKRLQNPKSATYMYQLFAAMHVNGTDCKLWVVKRILRWVLKAKRSLFRLTKLRARLLLSARRAFEATSLRVTIPDGIEEGTDPLMIGSSSEEEGTQDVSTVGALAVVPAASAKDTDLFAPPMPLGDCGGVLLTRSNASVKMQQMVEATAPDSPTSSSGQTLAHATDSSGSLISPSPSPAPQPQLTRQKSLLASPEEQRIAVHARIATEAIVNVIVLPPDDSSNGVTVEEDDSNGRKTINRSSAAPDSLAVELAGRLVEIILELEVDLREKRMLAIKFGSEGQMDGGKSQHSPRVRKDDMRGFGEGASLGMIKSQASVEAAERANPVGSAVNIALKKFQTYFLHSVLTMRAKGSAPQRGFISMRQIFSDVFRGAAASMEYGSADAARVSMSRSSRGSSVGSSGSQLASRARVSRSSVVGGAEKKKLSGKKIEVPAVTVPANNAHENPLTIAEEPSKQQEQDPETHLRELLLPILTKAKTKRRGRFVEHLWLNEYDDVSLDVLHRRERCLTNTNLVEEITTLFARLVETIESVDSSAAEEETGRRSMAGDRKRDGKRGLAPGTLQSGEGGAGGAAATTTSSHSTRRVPRKQFGTVLKVLVDRMVRRLLVAVVALMSSILADYEKTKHDCEDILSLTELPAATEGDDTESTSGVKTGLGRRTMSRPHCFNLFTDRLSSMCYPQTYVEFLRGWQWLCDEPLTIPTIWSSGRAKQSLSSGSPITSEGHGAGPPLAGHQLPLLFDVRALDKTLRFDEFVEKGQRSAGPIAVAEAVDMQPEDLDLLCQIFAPREQDAGGHSRTPRGSIQAQQQQRGAVAEEQFVITLLHILDMGHITLVAEKPPAAQSVTSGPVTVQGDGNELDERKKSSVSQQRTSSVVSKKSKRLAVQPMQTKRAHSYNARNAVFFKWDFFLSLEPANLLQDVSHVTIALFEKQLVKDLLADVLLELRLEMVRSWQMVQDRQLLYERKLMQRQMADKSSSSQVPSNAKLGGSTLSEDKLQDGIVKLLDVMPPSEKECFRLVQSVWRTEFDRRIPEDAKEWEATEFETGLEYLHRKINDCLKLKPSRLSLVTRCDHCHTVPSGLIYQHKLQPVVRSAALTQAELDRLLRGDASRDLQTTANFSYSHVEFFEGEQNRRHEEVLTLRRKGLTRSITDYVDLVLCFDCIPKYLARVLLKRLIEVLETASIPAPVEAEVPPSPAVLGRRRRSDLTKAQMHGADPTAASMTQEDWHQVNMIIRRKVELSRQKSQRRLSQVEDEDEDHRGDDHHHMDIGEGITESGTFRKKKKKKKAVREEEDDEMLELKTLDSSARIRGRKNLLEERLSAQLKVVYLQQLYEAQKAERKRIRVEERQIRIDIVTEFAKTRYAVNFGHLDEDDNNEPSADMMEGLAEAIAAALAAFGGGGGMNSLLDGLDDDIGDDDEPRERKPAQSKFASKAKASRDAKALLSKSGKTVEQLEDYVKSETARLQIKRAQDDTASKMKELEEARRELQELVAEKQRRAEKAKIEKQKQKPAELAAARSSTAGTSSENTKGSHGTGIERSRDDAALEDEDHHAMDEDTVKDIARQGGKFTRKKRNKVATFVEDEVAPDDDAEQQGSKPQPQPALPGQLAKAIDSVNKAAAEKKAAQTTIGHQQPSRGGSFRREKSERSSPEERSDDESSSSGSSNYDNEVVEEWMVPDPLELAAIRAGAVLADEVESASADAVKDAGVTLYDALIKTNDERAGYVAFTDDQSNAVNQSASIGQELTEVYNSFVAASRRSSLAKLGRLSTTIADDSLTKAASLSDAKDPEAEALKAAEELQKKLNESPLVEEWFTTFEADGLTAASDDSVSALEQKAKSSESQRNADHRTRMVYAILREMFAAPSRLLGEDTPLCRTHDKAIGAALRLFDCFGADNIFLREPELLARSNRLVLFEGQTPLVSSNELRGVGLQLWRDPVRKFGPMKWTLVNAPAKAQKCVQAYVRQCWLAAVNLAHVVGSPNSVPVFALAPVSNAPLQVVAAARRKSEPSSLPASSPKRLSKPPHTSPPTAPSRRRASDAIPSVTSLGVAMQASTGGADFLLASASRGSALCEDEALAQQEASDMPLLAAAGEQDAATPVRAEDASERRKSSIRKPSTLQRRPTVAPEAVVHAPPTGALIQLPSGTARAAAQACYQSRLSAVALLLLFQERSYVAFAETWVYCTHTLYLDLYGTAKVQRVPAHDFAKFSIFTLRSLRLELLEKKDETAAAQQMNLDQAVAKEWKISKSVMLNSQRHQVVRKYEALAFSHVFMFYCGIEEYAQSLLPTVAEQLASKRQQPSLAAELRITALDCTRLAELGTSMKISRLVLMLHNSQTAKLNATSTHQERLYDAAKRVQFLQELGRMALCMWVLGPLREARAAVFASGFTPHAACWNASLAAHPSPNVLSAVALLRFAEAHMCGADPYETAETIDACVRKKTEDHLVRSIVLAAPRRRSQVQEHSISVTELSAAEEKRTKESAGTSVYSFFFRSWTKSQLVSLGLQLLLSALSSTSSLEDGSVDSAASGLFVRKGFRFDPLRYRDSAEAHLASFGEAITTLTSNELPCSASLTSVLPTLNVGLQYCFAEHEVGTSTTTSPVRRDTVAELQQMRRGKSEMTVTEGLRPRAVAVLPFPAGDGIGGTSSLLSVVCSETLSLVDSQRAEKVRTEHRRYLDDVGIVLVACRKWFSERNDIQQRRKGGKKGPQMVSDASVSGLEGGSGSMTAGSYMSAAAHQFDFSLVGGFTSPKNVKLAGELFQQSLMARRASKALTAIIGEYGSASPPFTAQSINTTNAVASLMVSTQQLPRFALPPQRGSTSGGVDGTDEFAWSIPALPRMMSVLQVNERFGEMANAVSRQVGSHAAYTSKGEHDVASTIVAEAARDFLKKSVLFLPVFPTLLSDGSVLAPGAGGEGEVESSAVVSGIVVKESGALQEREVEDVRRRMQRKQETMSSFQLSVYLEKIRQRAERMKRQTTSLTNSDDECAMAQSLDELTVQGVGALPDHLTRKGDRRLFEFFVPVLATTYRLLAEPNRDDQFRGFVESDCIIVIRTDPRERRAEEDANGILVATCFFLHDVRNQFTDIQNGAHLLEVVASAPPLVTCRTPDSDEPGPSLELQGPSEESVVDVLRDKKQQMLRSLPWVECQIFRSGAGLHLQSAAGNYRMTLRHLELLISAAVEPRLVFPQTEKGAEARVKLEADLDTKSFPFAGPKSLPASVLTPQEQDILLSDAIAEATSVDVALLSFALQHLCAFPATTTNGTRMSHAAECAAKDRLLSGALNSEPSKESHLSRAMQETIRQSVPKLSNQLATPRNGFEPDALRDHANLVIASEPMRHSLPPLSSTPQPQSHSSRSKERERKKLAQTATRAPKRVDEPLPSLRPRGATVSQKKVE